MPDTTPHSQDSAPLTSHAALVGHRLLSLGLISRDQLDAALAVKARSTRMLGSILVDLGFITEDALCAVLSEGMGLDRFNPTGTLLDAETARRLPKQLALSCRVLLLSQTQTTAEVAMVDPYDVLAIDQVRRHLPAQVQVVPRVCTAADMAQAIDQAYGHEMSIDGILRELRNGTDHFARSTGEEGYTHPVVRLAHAILLDAVKQGASALHFEPEDLFLRLRYRIDGALHQIRAFHKDFWPPLAHRLKTLAGLTDTLSPQDGRFSLNLGSRSMEFRAAALDTIQGENIVLHVVDKSKSVKSLADLGFSGRSRLRLDQALKRPEGIIIVTGPGGSGKTTSLYAMLSRVNRVDVNLMTLEAGVEHRLPLIRQTEIRDQSGLPAAEGVRALLRQHPDILFIDELRDPGTAQMALHAAMSGHQVFTTLDANDAISAFARLLDLGLKPGLLAGNIIGIVAQRLVRTLCTRCRRERPATQEECRLLGISAETPPRLYDATGCPECHHTGYRGRVAVSELILVDEDVDDAIARGADRAELRRILPRTGFRPMREEGLEKVLAGEISLESLGRAIDLTPLLRQVETGTR
ncbi:GspE/PulE family protein [Oleisolibacter albus]|uniref:GspE/PulE family protein n=1 Tax=Oleisolibacter albus TaxID=2171757 RepID=UPI000DF18D94|nr:GspE/PulE family protein [Oleisolibacter albus]